MSKEATEKVACNSKKLARQYAVQRNFGRAFSHYLVSLQLKPEWKPLLKEEFSITLCKWGKVLEKNNRTSDLFQCYEQAIEIYPDNEIVLNNLGAHLLRWQFLKEASYYFQQALSVRPNFLRARLNLENVYNLAVERWHFRMLNDNHRNEAFRKAIVRKIGQGFVTVLDIGTGTGLLSLFCLEGKAREIYACDMSPVMIEIAEKVFERNHAHGITLIKKHSLELSIPQDIPRRLSLIVTETADSGLFGENILLTLSNAWRNLLLPRLPSCNSNVNGDAGFVLPCRAKLYVTGIECDSIRKRFYPTQREPWLKCESVNIGGKYDTQDLNLVEHKYLTQTETVFDIDFNDPNLIEKAIEGLLDKEMKLTVTRAGRLDCLAVWFDLFVDEKTVLNSGPESETNDAWDQAVFLLGHCRDVSNDEAVLIWASLAGGSLVIKCCDDVEKSCPQVSEQIVKLLNDASLIKSIREAGDKLLDRFDGSIHILEWFPFPVFGLSFLRARSEAYEDRLTCFVLSENDRRFVVASAEKSGLGSRVTVVCEDGIEDYLDEAEKFDLIVLNFVDSSGEIKEACVSQLRRLKTLLNPDGIILPEKVSVVGQLVDCDWLLKSSKVLNESVTCGYHIGEYINSYQVRHFIDFDWDIPRIPVCDPVELFSIGCDEKCFELTFPCLKIHPRCNAMIYWFQIRFLDGCDVISTNDGNSAFKQSAFLFPEMEIFNELTCSVAYSDGLFDVTIIGDDLIEETETTSFFETEKHKNCVSPL